MYGKADFQRLMLDMMDDQGPEVIFDGRRSRTAWFDGQHVTADHFNRDQSYHLTRHADMGRAIGQGVAEGLEVTTGGATSLTIAAGLGIAPSGEIIHIDKPVTLDLSDIPTQRRLNVALKRMGDPTPPLETRTGVFVLSASVVEFTSTPVANYPASVNAARSLQDSLINEAVLLSLTPEPIATNRLNDAEWRAQAAWRIFGEGREADFPAQALPLAMVALQGNRVLWVDGPLVRRELRAVNEGLAGVSPKVAAQRRAHFQQFDTLVTEETDKSGGAGFPASTLSRIIPAVGRLPAASVALRAEAGGPFRLSQSWLPADIPVELIALPADELDAVIADAVALPPIDLAADAKILANTPVTVVVPVPRSKWMTTPAEVAETQLPLTPPPAVGGRATSPEDLLRELLDGTPVTGGGEAAPEAWNALLSNFDELWYVRRTQHQRTDLAVHGIVTSDGEITEGGGDTPAPPVPAPEVDWDALIEAPRDHLMSVFSDNNMDVFVEGLFMLDGEVGVRAMFRLMEIARRGTRSGLFALGEMLQSGTLSSQELLEKIQPGTFTVLGQVEHGIFVVGAMRIWAPDINDAAQVEAVSKVLENAMGLKEDAARQIAGNRLPVVVRNHFLNDDTTYQKTVETLLGAGLKFDFVPLAENNPRDATERTRLAKTGRVLNLASKMTQIDPAVLRLGLTDIRRIWREPGLEGSDLGDALADAVGGL